MKEKAGCVTVLCIHLNREGKGKEYIVFYSIFILKNVWKKSEETINSVYQLEGQGGPGQTEDKGGRRIYNVLIFFT